MKRFSLFLLIAALLVVAISGVSATDPEAGPASMARFFDSDVDLFFATRTDEGFLDTLDALISRIIAKLPGDLNIPPISIKQQINITLASGQTNLNEVYLWLGDYAAVAVDNLEVQADDSISNNDQVDFVAAIALKDRAAFEAFLDVRTTGNLEKSSVGAFTVYSNGREREPSIIVDDETIYITNLTAAALTNRSARLSENANFQESVSKLPADNYNVVGYLDLSYLFANFSPGEEEIFNSLGFNVDEIGAVAIGFTILDGRTLTMDIVQDQSAMPTNLRMLSPIDPQFARFIPADAALVLHASDINATINGALTTISEAAAISGQEDPTPQIEAAFGFIGLTKDEALGWMTGDYALFVRYDTIQLIDLALQGPNARFVEVPLGFGVLIEATDEAAAQKFASGLANFMRAALANQDQITVATAQVNGVDVTQITLEGALSANAPIAFDIVIGVSDGVFFLASKADVEEVLSGGASLLDNPTFQEASRYFVDNPVQVLYADDDGLLGFLSILGLALAGPAIGNIFDDIMDDLDGSWIPTPDNRLSNERIYAQSGIDQTIATARALLDILGSSSISATATDDGWTITRAVITLQE